MSYKNCQQPRRRMSQSDFFFFFIASLFTVLNKINPELLKREQRYGTKANDHMEVNEAMQNRKPPLHYQCLPSNNFQTMNLENLKGDPPGSSLYATLIPLSS